MIEEQCFPNDALYSWRNVVELGRGTRTANVQKSCNASANPILSHTKLEITITSSIIVDCQTGNVPFVLSEDTSCTCSPRLIWHHQPLPYWRRFLLTPCQAPVPLTISTCNCSGLCYSGVCADMWLLILSYRSFTFCWKKSSVRLYKLF